MKMYDQSIENLKRKEQNLVRHGDDAAQETRAQVSQKLFEAPPSLNVEMEIEILNVQTEPAEIVSQEDDVISTPPAIKTDETFVIHQKKTENPPQILNQDSSESTHNKPITAEPIT